MAGLPKDENIQHARAFNFLREVNKMYNTIQRKYNFTFALVILLLGSFLVISSCGGGSGGGGGGTPTHSISGTVSGLSGTVVLQNNGGNDLTITANGPFTFSTAVADGSPYAVTVLTQPVGQTCSVASGTGTISGANVANVAVTCSTNTYTVGGAVSGLNGTVVLQNNGGNDLTITANGPFTFSTAVADGSPYAVTVLTQPVGQTCSVANGAGSISGANVANVAVTCSTNTYTVGGAVSGLNGTVVLQNNGGNDLTITANGPFTFSTAVADGSPYAVTVLTQPVGQTCSVASGTGTISGANVANVAVTCSTNTYTFTVTTSGTGTGTVTSTPGGIDCGATCSASYPFNTQITLTAVPSSGSIFEGFSGGCACITPTCTLTLTGDAAVTTILNTASTSKAGNQLGLNGGVEVAAHQQTSNPPPSSLDLTTFTIEAWVFPLANQDMLIVADSAYYVMVKAQTATHPLGVEFAVLTSTGYPAYQFFAGNLNPFKLNQWNHVVGMVDNSTRNLWVGINGELTGPLSLAGDVNTSYPQTFSLGNSYPSNLGNFPFIGRIDEIRLSSRMRYSANFTPASLLDPDGSTVGLWHFDETAGATSFVDSSGNDNMLIGLNGAATIAGTREVQASENALFYSLIRLDLSSTAGPVAIGDFNSDGINDIATAGVYAIANDKVTVLLGVGAGSFGPATTFSTGESGAHSSIAIADFNKDGGQDLAVANSKNDISILLGTGTGSFGTAATFPTESNPSSVTVGDFNGDGNPDMAVANSGGNTVSILLGTGTGSFGSPTNYPVGLTPRSVAVGEFNGDGIPDLAVANSGGNTVSILLGTGTGSFGLAANFTVGNGPSSLAIGDFNNDGKLDISTANYNSASVSVLLGTGTGSFGSATNFAVGSPFYLAIGDLNGDGSLDIAVANGGGSPEFSIFLGDGSGSFGSPITFFTESNPLSVAIGDLTGDGKPDLVIGVSFSKIYIFVAR